MEVDGPLSKRVRPKMTSKSKKNIYEKCNLLEDFTQNWLKWRNKIIVVDPNTIETRFWRWWCWVLLISQGKILALHFLTCGSSFCLVIASSFLLEIKTKVLVVRAIGSHLQCQGPGTGKVTRWSVVWWSATVRSTQAKYQTGRRSRRRWSTMVDHPKELLGV